MERLAHKSIAIVIAMMLATGLAACLCPKTAHADRYSKTLMLTENYFNGDGITYKGYRCYPHGKGLAAVQDNNKSSVKVPATLKGKPVVAFSTGDGVTSVDLSKARNLECLIVSGSLKKIDLSKCPRLKIFACFQAKYSLKIDFSKNSKLKYMFAYGPVKSVNTSKCPFLKVLELSSTRISKLDVSNNKKLVEYYGDENPHMTTLNFAKNTNLTTLYCGFCNIKRLVLPSNGKLSDLGCRSNKLTSLDLSKSKKLVNLDCSNNKLTKLRAAGLSKLESLYCEKNKIAKINLTGCKRLEYFDCSSNRLTGLSVSKKTRLETVYCDRNRLARFYATGCKSLATLDCSHNKLTKLSVGTCPKLFDLDCSYNKLTKLSVAKNPRLWDLNCKNNALTGLNVTKNAKLEYVDCRNNKITALKLAKAEDEYNRLLYSGNPLKAPTVKTQSQLMTAVF